LLKLSQTIRAPGMPLVLAPLTTLATGRPGQHRVCREAFVMSYTEGFVLVGVALVAMVALA
jgi:hypothetical protein